MPARTSTATSTVAIREKPRNAATQLRGQRPDTCGECDETADPHHRRDEVEPVGEAGEERGVRLDALVAGHRQPGREQHADDEGRPQEPGRSRIQASRTSAVTTASPASWRRTQCRSGSSSRSARGRRRGGRRTAAGARRRPHHEGRDSHVERGDPAGRGEAVESVGQPSRQRLAEHEQAEARRSDQERQPDEVRPPSDVVGPGRSVEPYASVGGGGLTPIPKVYTPDPVWPSDDVARQRTV